MTIQTTLTTRVEKLRAELAEAENNLNQYQALTPVHKLAEELHKKLCHWNHTDGCSWGYEHNYGSADYRFGHEYAHDQYLEKAQKIAAVTDPEVAIQVFQEL
jgi:hypothetical protein